MGRIKGHIPEILLICALIVGIGLMSYPFVSDWVNDKHQSRAIATYEQAVEDTSSADLQRMWDEAVAYNQTLGRTNNRFNLSDEEIERYNETLDVTGTGIMGTVKIPKINVKLPIYHGTDDTVLQVAIGHIPGSSLPVGGEGTHVVISGHRGLPSARLFTDIDQLQEGDRFQLSVLGKTLTYQVDQIRIVEPDKLDDLAIQEGLDLCTLVTCTPYGVNTHRLLVRGHRVPNQEFADIDGDTTRVDPLIQGAGCTVVVCAIAGIVVLARRRIVKKRETAAVEAEILQEDKKR